MRTVLLSLLALVLVFGMGVIAAGDPEHKDAPAEAASEQQQDGTNESTEESGEAADPARPFTVEQAERGVELYARQCAECHGDNLLGGHGFPSLAGTGFMAFWRGSTGEELLEVVKTMPLGRPNSLSEQEYLSLVALILQVNNYEAGDTELVADSDFLNQIIIEPQN